MEQVDEVVELALTLGKVTERERERLRILCQGALEELSGRLKQGVGAEDCAPALTMAAAWMALAGLEAGGRAGGVESFTAGEVTVRQGSGTAALERSRELRRRAEELMAPYLAERSFAFQGVRG